MRLHQKIADKWTSQLCTLDGQMAIVCGRLNNFASIRSIDEPWKYAQFSWIAVDRIMNKDKAFKL